MLPAFSYFFKTENIPGRFTEWWHHKTPFLTTPIYALVLVKQQVPSFASVLLFLCSYLLTSTAGYMINDWFDREADHLAGKKNILTNFAGNYFLLIIAGCLAMSILPWILFFHNAVIATLLSVEYLLLFLYSVKPFRFKERAGIAYIVDSMYAYVIPFATALFLFNPLPVSTMSVVLYLLWLFVVGIRNILMHFYFDYNCDIRAGTPTLATIKGQKFVKRLAERLCFPIELGLAAYISLKYPVQLGFIGIAFIAYSIMIYFRESYYFIYRGMQLPRGYNFISNILLNGFYSGWLPVLLLIKLVFLNWTMSIILFLHLTIFYRQTNTLLTDLKFCFWDMALKLYYRVLGIIYHQIYRPVKLKITEIRYGSQ